MKHYNMDTLQEENINPVKWILQRFNQRLLRYANKVHILYTEEGYIPFWSNLYFVVVTRESNQKLKVENRRLQQELKSTHARASSAEDLLSRCQILIGK